MLLNLTAFLFCVTMVLTQQCQASSTEYCRLHPKDLNTVATRVLLASQEDEKPFPNVRAIQPLNFSGRLKKSDVHSIKGTYEAFARVQNDGTFSYIPFPIGAIELNHERDILYICAHVDPDPSKRIFVMYFMTGYDLGETSLKSFFGDLLFNSVKVAPVSISPVGFDMVENAFGEYQDLFIVKVALSPINLASGVQRAVMTAIKHLIPAGVERIIITNKEVVFSAGIDLENPDHVPVVSYVMQLEQSNN